MPRRQVLQARRADPGSEMTEGEVQETRPGPLERMQQAEDLRRFLEEHPQLAKIAM